jgi:hypothetical protein
VRLLRIVLLLLLSVALPLQVAVGARAELPCPMHAAGTAMDGAGDAAVPDCCDDADTRGGTACKTGADCQPGSMPLAAPAPVGRPPMGKAVLSLRDPPPRATATAADIWRPPSVPGS